MSSAMTEVQAKRLDAFEWEVNEIRTHYADELEKHNLRWHVYELDGILARLRNPELLEEYDEFRVDHFNYEMFWIRKCIDWQWDAQPGDDYEEDWAEWDRGMERQKERLRQAYRIFHARINEDWRELPAGMYANPEASKVPAVVADDIRAQLIGAK